MSFTIRQRNQDSTKTDFVRSHGANVPGGKGGWGGFDTNTETIFMLEGMLRATADDGRFPVMNNKSKS